jgi:hypothetical protein
MILGVLSASRKLPPRKPAWTINFLPDLLKLAGKPPSLQVEGNPLPRTPAFFSTWTLMPLRATLAFKHNHKADPPFPRG